MGNQISQQLQHDYQKYMESSNEILSDMAVNLNPQSVEIIRNISNIGGRNSQVLYFITYIIHFLYGNDDSILPPFDSPNVNATTKEQLCYDMKLVRYLRQILFNEESIMDVDETIDDSDMEKVMFRNLITYLELVKVVKAILEKYRGIEFSQVKKDLVFDYNYVDFKTTVEIEEFISSPIQLPRNSASDSIVFRGQWKQKWVYVKTFDKNNQALLYEKEIYRYIKSQLATRQDQDIYKRHFIIPKFVCQYGKDNRIANVTEDSGGISVQNLMKKVNISPYEYIALIFQLLYIICLMHTIGISHNDVHLGNVIATPRKPEEQAFHRFDHNGKEYNIYPYGTMYNCKIYDFDRASSIFHENLTLDETGLCREFGQCNRKDSQKDVFNTLMLIHMYNPEDTVMKSFHQFLWQEMKRVNESAAKELEAMVVQNMTTGTSWQTYCSSNRAVKCEFTFSPLMDLSVFLDIFSNAMEQQIGI